MAPGDALPHVRKVLPAADERGAIALLVGALDPPAAGQLLPELIDLLRAGRAAVPVARLLGGLDGVDRKTLRLLATAMRSDNAMLRATAAASHALLTGEREPAIQVFGRCRRRPAGRLVPPRGRPSGRRGRSLVPRIEELLGSREPWPRVAAAEAHWRITGDPACAVPVLTELAEASPVGLRALETLAEIGTTQTELRPRLRHFAWSRSAS